MNFDISLVRGVAMENRPESGALETPRMGPFTSFLFFAAIEIGKHYFFPVFWIFQKISTPLDPWELWGKIFTLGVII